MAEKKCDVAEFESVISGVKVKFPVKPYPSQMAMMAQIIRGLNRRQNCLLESPTGSGKSLALLCSTLAWQTHEEERIKEYNDLISQGISDPDVLARMVGGPPIHDDPPPLIAPSCSSTGAPSDLTANTSLRDDASDQPDDRSQNPPTTGGGFIIDGSDEDFRESKFFRIPWSSLNDSSVAGGLDESAGDFLQTDILNATNTPFPRKKRVPRIFYGTRTHKQLSQVVRELGRTKYSKVKMVVLGSREHTCIHPLVSTIKNKHEKCRIMRNGLEGDYCIYHHGSTRLKTFEALAHHGISGAWDLEDLVKVGRKVKACPYYASKHLLETAQIIFAPYNYLVDPIVRDMMSIDLRDAVVILDEAHNIEDSAREAASCSLQQDVILEAVKDLEKLAYHNVKPSSCKTLIEALCSISHWMDSYISKLTDYSEYNRSGKIFTGSEMMKNLQHLGIDKEKYLELEGCLKALNEDSPPEEQIPKPSSATSGLLEHFFLMFHYLTMDENKYCQDYKVALVRSQSYSNAARKDINGWISRKRNSIVWVYSLNFWCLNPGVSFYEVGQKARNVILTSGTLSPMNSFQSELGITFPIQLEANHVVKKEQVWVGTISKGPTDKSLNGTFRNSETFAFQDEVGRLVLEVCKTIPSGVLCFVPSYSMLNKLVERWQTTNMWSELEEIKVALTEPRKSTEFDDTLIAFYNAIQNSSGKIDSNAVNGAFLIAVCRGKVSEGMDFSDDNARAVITVGIPFPNVKDIQVDLKKQFNNSNFQSRGLLNGNEWYEIQAFRALNQALGRCLRHRHDWGALILVDDRYQYSWGGQNKENRYTKGLSKWVRKSIRHHTSFSAAIQNIKEFAQHMIDHPPGGAVTADVSSPPKLQKLQPEGMDTPINYEKLLTKYPLNSSASEPISTGGMPLLIDSADLGSQLIATPNHFDQRDPSLVASTQKHGQVTTPTRPVGSTPALSSYTHQATSTPVHSTPFEGIPTPDHTVGKQDTTVPIHLDNDSPVATRRPSFESQGFERALPNSVIDASDEGKNPSSPVRSEFQTAAESRNETKKNHQNPFYVVRSPCRKKRKSFDLSLSPGNNALVSVIPPGHQASLEVTPADKSNTGATPNTNKRVFGSLGNEALKLNADLSPSPVCGNESVSNSRFSYQSDEDMFVDHEESKPQDATALSHTAKAESLCKLSSQLNLKGGESSVQTKNIKEPVKNCLSNKPLRRRSIQKQSDAGLDSSDSDLDDFDLNSSRFATLRKSTTPKNRPSKKPRRKGVHFSTLK